MTKFKPGELCHVSIQQGGRGFMYELPSAVIKDGKSYFTTDEGCVEYTPVDSTEFDVIIIMLFVGPFDGEGTSVRYVALYRESLIVVYEHDLERIESNV